VTAANAEYQLTIQQAKIARQEAIRSAIQTRHAAIEQAEYERAHMPDPEKIRQKQQARDLDRARSSPPLTEIWSGQSLNLLLGKLIAQQGQGVRGADVPLNENMLKCIQLTAGDTRGEVGLLKDKGRLQWPQPLQREMFKEARASLERRLKDAVRTVSVGNQLNANTLDDLHADCKKLNDTLDAHTSTLSPGEHIEAKRYLKLVGNAVTALKDRNVSKYFDGTWTAKSKDVSELVKFMDDEGLWFAPALPGDESAYLALYRALSAFDTGMPRMADAGGEDE
jgi:hypothetical protein